MIPSASKDVGQLEFLYVASGNVEQYSTLKNNLADSYRVKNTLFK